MKISARKILSAILLLFFVALLGMTCIAFGYEIGRYLVYVTVPVGAFLTIASAVLAMLGKLHRDL